MAGGYKRTSCGLAIVAVIFIIVIIILCLVPDPCTKDNRSAACRKLHPDDSHYKGSQSTTELTTESTTSKGTSTTERTLPPIASTESSVSSSSISSSSISSTSSSISSTSSTISSSSSSSTFSTSTQDSWNTNDTTTDISRTTQEYNVTEYTGTTVNTTSYDESSSDTTDTVSYNESSSTTTEEVNATSATTEDTTSQETMMTTAMMDNETTTELQTNVTIEEERNYCDTPICREVARRMLDIMDPNDVNPCQDFYQYACGGILDDPFLKPENPQLYASNTIKAALSKADRNDEELGSMLKFYDNCLNYSKQSLEDRQMMAREVFEDLGYKFNPMHISKFKSFYNDSDYPENFDISIALAKMMKVHFTPFFDMMLDVNEEDRTVFQLKMTLPAFQSAFSKDRSKSVCLSEYRDKANKAKRKGIIFDVNAHYEEYVTCVNVGNGLKERAFKVKDVIRQLNLTDSLHEEDAEQIITQTVFNVENLLEDFSKIIPSPPEQRKQVLERNYKLVTVKQLDDGSIFNQSVINFERFFKELDFDIDPEVERVQLYFSDTFQKIFEIIDNFYYEEGELGMQNVLLLLWTERVYNDLIEPIGNAPGSHEYCFEAVTKHMAISVSKLYLQEFQSRDGVLKRQMEDMIKMSKKVALDQVDRSNSVSKGDFTAKLVDMEGVVASHKDFSEHEHAVKVAIDEKNFGKNYLNLMKNFRSRYYALKPNMPEDSVWILQQFVYEAKAVTSYPLNKFLISYADMSSPLYYEGVPKYINYAGLGHVIAHEIMHGFDATGMQYNSDGRNSMTEDRSLTSASECLAEQLSGTKFINSSTKLSAKFKLHHNLALNELLADSAAIQLAWDSYQQDLHYQQNPQPTTITPELPAIRPSETHGSGSLGEVRNFRLNTPEFRVPDEGLPHFEEFTPLQLYFIKNAQNQCGASSEVDLIAVMEDEHLPPKLRVNLGIGNNELFKEAFNCRTKPSMIPSYYQCPFLPTKFKTHMTEGGGDDRFM